MSMRNFILFLGAAIGTAGLGVACNEPSAVKTNWEQQPMDYTAVAQSFLTDSLPNNADTLTVGFRDLNFYTSKDHFCLVGIVDNPSVFWQKIWLKTQLVDSSGTALRVDGDTTLFVQAFSEAVPPRGATAFFAAVPLSRISGIPASCRVACAGAVQRPPGPILIAYVVSGTGMLFPDSTAATGVKERFYDVNANLSNPLNASAYHPRVVLLMYGNDSRLYYAQLVNPEAQDAPIEQENQGPMSATEQRNIFCRINYELLPEPLQNLRISRVEMQAFDAR